MNLTRAFSLLFSVCLALMGCAESGSSGNAASDGVAAPTQPLPERPAAQSTEIFNRDLLFKNDPRVSYCEIVENQKETYSGMRDTTLEPLASLSKLITTSWALEKLGSDFRFQSEIYLNPVQAGGVYDVFLKTNLDPIVNIEKLLYFISKMNEAGVRQIRNLVIDEGTRIFLGVLSNPHIELMNTPISINESIENLNLIFNSKNWAEKTKVAKANLLSWAQKNNKVIRLPEQFSVASVTYRSANQVLTQNYSSKIIVPSAPLFKYLKNVNVNSNNYISDALFNYLGGSQEFKKFQKEKLGLFQNELQVFTGSGLSDSSVGFRQDNLGTCFSMIRVLSFLKNKAAQAQLNLGALLLNPNLDQDGTFETTTDYQSAVVLKTGRLYEVPALNLAGFVATANGVVSFAFLAHDFNDSDAKEIEKGRAQMLDDIMAHYRTRGAFNSIDYENIFF